MHHAVVFEIVKAWHRPLIWWYGRQGHPIYYLRVSPSLRPGVVREETARRLLLPEPLHWGHNPSGNLAFAAVDGLYDAVRDHPLVHRFLALYDSPDVHLAFKKSLCTQLERHAYYVFLRRRIAVALAQGHGWMLIPAAPHDDALPARFVPLRRSAGSSSPDGDTPWWVRGQARLLTLWDHLKWGGLALDTVVRSVFEGLWPRRRGPKERWQYGIALVSPSREFANEVRGVDFLLDGQRIHAANTLFIPLVPLPAFMRERLRLKGLRLGEVPSGSPGTFGATASHAIELLRYLGAEPWLARAAAHLLREYGRWTAFTKRYHVGHFITYADFGLRHIGRNILLRRAGTTTWYYADTVNTTDTFPGEPYRNAAWGWLLYDNFVSWCERFSQYFALHPQRIGRFINVGCLWSEHVRLIKSGRIPSSFTSRLPWRGGVGVRVVGVFDSTYRDDTATTYEDGMAFARGIQRLLDERADLAIIWKEKKPRSSHRTGDALGLATLYHALAQHPRCFFTGHEVSPSEALAACELAISFPFTSPTLEALGAGVRALYFDPLGKYRASYYDAIPGLVAHGYEELRSRVDALLDRTSAGDYLAYLERYVKGEVDPYMDARALTRFRALLAGQAVDDRPVPATVSS